MPSQLCRSASATLYVKPCPLVQHIRTITDLTMQQAGPVISSDFPDPAIIKVGDTWYAFGTQSVYDYTNVKVQIATSNDFYSWSLRGGQDVLRNLPSWVSQSNPKVWAPDVFQRDDGTFVMYFSATTTTAGNGNFHCIGTAISSNVDGPYDSNSDTPFACDTDQGGSIDASHFRDVDGSNYITYKIDGNALGNGGACGNTVAPIKSTPIMLQKVDTDGVTKIGGRTEILTNGQYDGPLVEAPAIMRTGDGTYVLFFSSQCYIDANYDTSYATASNIAGPYTKTQYPLYNQGFQGDVRGPGGADVDPDSTHVAFHAYATSADVGRRRAMFVSTVRFSNNVVSY
jgi:beta-xylosidase